MASYDDLGKIQKSAYILEKGTYKFFIGTSVRNTEEGIQTMELSHNIITRQLTAHMVPSSLKERMLSDGPDHTGGMRFFIKEGQPWKNTCWK